MTLEDNGTNSGNAAEQTEDAASWFDDWAETRRSLLKKGAAASGAVGLSLGATGTGLAHGQEYGNGEEGTETPTESDGDSSAQSATVAFENQATDGRSVTVDSTNLPEGGYVAIHDASLLEGNVLESVVGVSDYLEAGSHEHVEITLFEVEGANFQMSQLEGSQPLIAMPHQETNDNETYEFVASGGKQDGPYVDDGQAVVGLGFVSVGNVATVAFDNQRTDGTTLTIRSTTLSEGGFITIHDARLFEGQALESAIGVSDYLKAGTHENIEITLFNVKGAKFKQSSLQETQVVVPMPHLDSNGNQEYDFVESGGKEDGPYTTDGQAVVDIGYAVLE